MEKESREGVLERERRAKEAIDRGEVCLGRVCGRGCGRGCVSLVAVGRTGMELQ
jgi:hypothetical protein